ncbi:hypothetical protein AVEN_223686-1 [Araneus ventricosus]|uniref:Uncharacterized protein n=1 Tax=Araneus ventricosus TaxID=182803 RepID=A0A4Y2RTS8_ARAVE|nr:hypothetical protein AVEN_223686-1 [Araneus ventricosus]
MAEDSKTNLNNIDTLAWKRYLQSVDGIGAQQYERLSFSQDKDKCESSVQSLESDSYVTEISEIQPNGYLVPTKTPGESLLKDLKERDGNVSNCIMKLTRESSNVIPKPADANDVFGKYVASELNAITDKRILSEAKVAIEGILNDARIMILKDNTLL